MLESTGHASKTRQPIGDLVEGQPEGEGAAHRYQSVLHVERADQVGCDGDGSLIRHQVKTRPA